MKGQFLSRKAILSIGLWRGSPTILRRLIPAQQFLWRPYCAAQGHAIKQVVKSRPHKLMSMWFRLNIHPSKFVNFMNKGYCKNFIKSSWKINHFWQPCNWRIPRKKPQSFEEKGGEGGRYISTFGDNDKIRMTSAQTYLGF